MAGPKLNPGPQRLVLGRVGCADVLIEWGKDRCQTIGQSRHVGSRIRDWNAEVAIVLLDCLPHAGRR